MKNIINELLKIVKVSFKNNNVNVNIFSNKAIRLGYSKLKNVGNIISMHNNKLNTY